MWHMSKMATFMMCSGGVALHVLDFILLFCINNHCTDFIQSIELIIYHYSVPTEQLSCATCLFIYFTFGFNSCMHYYM